MYELGALAASEKPLVVGCPVDPDMGESIASLFKKTRPDAIVYRTLIEVMNATGEAHANLA